MPGRVEGKVVLVFGAGSIGPGWGNGKAASVLYAREGARVALVDRSLDAAQETHNIIREEGGESLPIAADIGSAEDVESCVAQCVSEFGRLDVLHNNVGVPFVGGPEATPEADWDRLFDVNVKGMYLTCRAVLPHMVQQRAGAIVNISSIASLRFLGYPCVAYAAGKGAVNQLTQSIAVQYAKDGIRANSVLPGLMHTPLIEHYVTDGYGGDVQTMIDERNALVPMGRMGDAWDVAYASLYLASDEAKYVTATQLVVDGGITSTVSS